MGRRRSLLVILFAAVFSVVYLGSRYATSTNPQLSSRLTASLGPSGPHHPVASSCTQHLGWLEPYQFTSSIEYVSRDIIARPRLDAKRPSLTVVDEPLFESYTSVNLAESQMANIEYCLPPLELDVPRSSLPPVDASNLIFGLQTNIERLRDTVKHLARWLPHTGARLYAIVIDVRNGKEVPADDNDMKALEKEMRGMGMNVRITHPLQDSDSFAQRYFSLTKAMYDARDDKTQWTIFIDDDTFFPSMYDLKSLLSEHDWRKPQYVGSLSEDWWAVNHYGLMGFGGAGIMISLPLAEIMNTHYDECKSNPRTTSGDVTVMDCIYSFSPTKLTSIPSLHQVDMKGDLTGFYESGREVTSLHHWKQGSSFGYKLELEKMHLVANICDSCFLQRWQFPHELILSNGFSIAAYPEGHLTGQRPGTLGGIVDPVDLGQMEKTWGDNINVLHSLAPLRPKLSGSQKVGYMLLDSMLIDGVEIGSPGEKVVRQVYFKEGGDRAGRDTVMVLNWRSAPEKERQHENNPMQKPV